MNRNHASVRATGAAVPPGSTATASTTAATTASATTTTTSSASLNALTAGAAANVIEVSLTLPELGLEGLLDECAVGASDTVRDVVQRLVSRYGVDDATHFGMRQRDAAGDRWLDDKVRR
jgi:hypothetical protein